MSRSLPEWIGKTDDTPVPPRVRLRVFERFGRRCDRAGGCGRAITPGHIWACDHIDALANGGENRERNLHPLCSWCHPVKTGADVAEKSRIYRKQLRHAGIKLRPTGRPLMGTVASGWRKRMDGTVERVRHEPHLADHPGRLTGARHHRRHHPAPGGGVGVRVGTAIASMSRTGPIRGNPGGGLRAPLCFAAANASCAGACCRATRQAGSRVGTAPTSVGNRRIADD